MVGDRPAARARRQRRRLARRPGRQARRQRASSASPSPTPTATRSRSTSSPARRPPATATTPPSTAASNLGPENVVDTLPTRRQGRTPASQSLLTQVCARSKAVGELEGVDGARPVLHRRTASARCSPCSTATADRSGHPRGQRQPGLPGHAVRRHLPGRDGGAAPSPARTTRTGVITPIRGDAPADRPCPPTRSPPAAAASTRTSARPTPTCRRRGSPGSAASTVGHGRSS